MIKSQEIKNNDEIVSRLDQYNYNKLVHNPVFVFDVKKILKKDPILLKIGRV